MSIRRFDGVDDRVTLELGGARIAFGPGTIAAVVRRSADGVLHELLFVGVSGSSDRYALRLGSSNALGLVSNANEPAAPTIKVTVADGWCVVAATKATGTVAPRFHKYVFSTGRWTHENAGTTAANGVLPNDLATMGAREAGFSVGGWLAGDLGRVAVWNRVLSDAEIRTLAFSAGWVNSSPVALWPLTEANTSDPVQDSIGAADQRSIVGTQVIAEDVPWASAFLNDTFTDPSGTILSAHVGEVGATWTKHAASGAPNIVVSNANRVYGTGTNSIYYASGVPAAVEYDIEHVARYLSTPDSGNVAPGVTARHNISADTFYMARLAHNQLELYKRVAGTFTLLGSFAFVPTVGVDYAVKLQVRDATKKVFLDGVERISSVDNAITDAGRVGIRSGATGAVNDALGGHIDTITATDLVSVPPPPPPSDPILVTPGGGSRGGKGGSGGGKVGGGGPKPPSAVDKNKPQFIRQGTLPWRRHWPRG